jgi:hypothetical protein
MIETVEEESSLNTLESQSSDVKIEVDDESD